MAPRSRVLAAGSLVMIALLWGPQIWAEGLLLPLVRQIEDGRVHYWWALEASDEAWDLNRQLARSSQGEILDPSSIEEQPNLSRIYRQDDLSVDLARALGRLYDARVVLLGSLSLEQPQPVQGQLFWVGWAELRVQFQRVDLELMTGEIRQRFMGRGASPEQARDEARMAALEYLSSNLSSARMRTPVVVSPEDVENPTLVVLSLSVARLLVAFKGDLRRHADIVQDVDEVWAGEGRIGMEVQLAQGATEAELDGLLLRIMNSGHSDYELLIESRQGLMTELRLLPPREQLEQRLPGEELEGDRFQTD